MLEITSLPKLYNHAKSEISPTDAYSGTTADFKARVVLWAPISLANTEFRGEKKDRTRTGHIPTSSMASEDIMKATKLLQQNPLTHI